MIPRGRAPDELQLALLRALPAAVVLVDAEGRVVAANDAWRRFTVTQRAQRTRHYLRAWSAATGVASADATRIASAVRQVLGGQSPLAELEIPVRGADGQAMRLELRVSPLDPGAPGAGVVVVHLEHRTERPEPGTIDPRFGCAFDAVFQACPLGIAISEAGTWRLVRTNPALRALFEADRPEGPPADVRDLPIWPSADEASGLLARAADGAALKGVEIAVPRPQGTRTLRLSFETVPPGGPGRPPLVIIVVEDISDRRSLEERFREAQRIEAVGRLAGGVAHDFNNLLTVIIGYNEALDFEDRLGETAREAVQQIRLATERATMLTRQLLAFSRRQVLQPQVLDIRVVTAQLLPMLRRLLGEDIALAVESGADPAIVRADPGQLEQVLMNLAVNARDAMPQGGRLTIGIRHVDYGADFVASHPYVVPGRYVELTVRDTGMGMSADTRARVFEPFFTTKPPGQGTGLGLATVYGIVKQSDGYIWVDSEPGQGATFRIALPAAPEEELRKRPAAEPPHASGGDETVLLVEDEDALRELHRQVLMRYGYRVLPARTGPEAQATAEAHPGPIHLLLTDVVMPAMSGRELADALRRVRPDTKVLYMSGYTTDAIVRHGVSEATTAFIQKPMAPPALARKVREVLDG